MSHYVVMVIGDDVESLLAPYDENMEVEPYIDRTADDIINDFNKTKISSQKDIDEGKGSEFDIFTASLSEPNDKWVFDYYGCNRNSEGNILTSYNPESKWDWYCIGGRWSGELILKNGCIGKLGKRSWTNDHIELPSNRVDIARKCDIDWDAMNKVAVEEKLRIWDVLFSPNGEERCYYSPEYIEKSKETHLKIYKTRENYAKRRGYWTPYAIVTDEGWFAPGDMGWFGLSSDETSDRDSFIQTMSGILDRTPDNEIITIVDCHI